MKHVTYAEKALLVGDDAADTLLEYARVIADTGGADTVTLRAIGRDGNTVEASFLLSQSTDMMVESTNSDVEAPDNEQAVRDMRERITAIARPVRPESEPWIETEVDSVDRI